MKTKLTMMVAMAAACAATQLTAMPTAEETMRAESGVRKLLKPERAALKSGRKTRSEVADKAMKLADEADSDAAKLLLMKGAFVLYVQDGNLEKAADAMKAIKAAIPDIPPQYVTNMIKTALNGVDGARLYELLGEAKTESTTEKTRKDIAKLFPGWSLDSEVPQENRKEWASGFCANHRGQDSVLRLHPVNRETPIVLSRTLTLSKGNPCLFLKTASFDKDSDFLLSVLVNGKEVLPKRLIRTPDSAPWQDITVPLSAWRGSKVKIEVVLTANDWWLEHPFFKRLEVAEGIGQERIEEAKGHGENVLPTTSAKTNDSKDVPNVEYKFSYRLENGMAIITAIDPKPVGTVVIPDKIDGHKVTGFERYPAPSPFAHCDKVTKIVLPAGMKDPAGLETCKSLSSIEVSKSNKDFVSRDGVLYSKDFSTLFVYPKTRESVELSPKTRKVRACAFRGCALKTAKIPEGIVEVEPWNLCECPDLEWIEFPKSLKYLGQCAACGSGKLKKIVFNGNAPQIGLGQFSWGRQYVFTGAPKDLVVEVRKGTKGWKSPGSRELPECWPTNQSESRPIRYIK